MTGLNLQPNSKPVRTYFDGIQQKRNDGHLSEGNVAPLFADLLNACARQKGWTLNEQHSLTVGGGRRIRLDGALLDTSRLRRAIWEAKDSADDLAVEVQRKRDAGYPQDNILYQSPDQLILVQNGREVRSVRLDDPDRAPHHLVDVLAQFFDYTPPLVNQWEDAVEAFKDRVPELAGDLDALIEQAYREDGEYRSAFETFHQLCRDAIDPGLGKDAVEEMLIQHLLTERIFRGVFRNTEFRQRNAIARAIEEVITALTRRHFNRDEFMRGLDHFYGAIETTAATLHDYGEKQDFLNTVYERFFQGHDAKTADTHGIVYTPQPIVEFMVRSVETLLKREFDTSLADDGVHILDPFVGTGNFMLRVMEEIRAVRPSALPHKYKHELHCNEVMLLPYYIASMNIENAYYEAVKHYDPFPGICLVDTFSLAEGQQALLFPGDENTERVQAQRRAELTVILGNPPYNVGQVSVNDNNMNKSYAGGLDDSLRATYVQDSTASNRNKLYDPYVRAFRWAADRLKRDGGGVLAYVSNNSFLNNIAFDGMRKHLLLDFDAVYVLDLGGNVRQNPKLSGTTHNVFGIQVGVAVTLLVRRRAGDAAEPRSGALYYARMDEYWRRGQKYDALDQAAHLDGIAWERLTPNARHLWLTDGMEADFDDYPALGTQAAKAKKGGAEAIFTLYSLGVASARDAWVYNFRQDEVSANVRRMIGNYNYEVFRVSQADIKGELALNNFINNDPSFVGWNHGLKRHLAKGRTLDFDETQIRRSLYRPFTQQYLYFDHLMNQRRYQQHRIFPTPATEAENRVIWLKVGMEWPMFALMANTLVDLLPQGGSQCFPLYVYNEDGSGRRDNISDWALESFRHHYDDLAISKEAIFYAVYAALHHPTYRQRYAANLKRSLPRIPYMSGFRALESAGRALAALHIGYESAPEHPLVREENPALPFTYRVEKMRFNRDKTAVIVNDSLTLSGIPPQAHDYRLGSRSALEWVVDQYRVKTDKRSGITSDPNRLDDPGYIVRLLGQVVHVSLETQRLVAQIAESTWEGVAESDAAALESSGA